MVSCVSNGKASGTQNYLDWTKINNARQWNEIGLVQSRSLIRKGKREGHTALSVVGELSVDRGEDSFLDDDIEPLIGKYRYSKI